MLSIGWEGVGKATTEYPNNVETLGKSSEENSYEIYP